MTPKWLPHVLAFLLIAGVAFAIYFWSQQTDDSNNSVNNTVTQEEDVFANTGNLIKDNPGFTPGVWYLSYEQAGAAALSAELKFNNESRCYGPNLTGSCDPTKLFKGDRVFVTGLWDELTKTPVLVQRLDVLTTASGVVQKERTIQLFYYNETRDKEIAGGNNVACDPAAALPVTRNIPLTNTPIQDAIRELIKGNLTPAEKTAGYKTEFPHPDFKLVGANLAKGILTLEFTEVPGFTTGGSCRVRILWAQIEKTAKQFSEVREVNFKPESLFQP